MYAVTFNDRVLFTADEEFCNKFVNDFIEYRKIVHEHKYNIHIAESNLWSDKPLSKLYSEQRATEVLIQNAISNKEFDKFPELTNDLDTTKKSIEEYRSKILDPLNNELEEYLKTVPDIHKKFINYIDNANRWSDYASSVLVEKLDDYNEFVTMLERD